MAQSLTPAEYAQLQQLINQMQSNQSPPATSQHPVILCPPTPRPPTPRPLHPTLLLPAPSAPISHSYQSFRTQAPQEYPTISNGHSALPSLPTSQPFLGFSSLGTSLIGQVNQQRLASSAATQPRQPQLPLRGRRRGPAIRPPQLPRAPKLEDCVSHIASEPLIQLVVKVYPPQVNSLNVQQGIVLLIFFIYSELGAKICSTTDIYVTLSQLGWKKWISIIPLTSLHQPLLSALLNKSLCGWRIPILLSRLHPPLMITHFCEMKLYPCNCSSLRTEVFRDLLTCKFDYAAWLCLQTLPSMTSLPIALGLQ